MSPLDCWYQADLEYRRALALVSRDSGGDLNDDCPIPAHLPPPADLTRGSSWTPKSLSSSRDRSRQRAEAEPKFALDFAAGVADIDQALGHHVELLQGVRVLRVLDVPDVLQTEPIGTC